LQPDAWISSRIADAARSGQSRASVRFRDQRGQVAGLRERSDEFGGVPFARFQIAPVLAVEGGADAPHAVADLGKVLAEGETDRSVIG
jgi:hypothetical protein